MCVFICLTYSWKDNDDNVNGHNNIIITTVMTMNLLASLIIKFIYVH